MMMKKKCSAALLFAALLWNAGALAQSNRYAPDASEYVSRVHMGLGFGLDYGGLGFKAEFFPVKQVGIFGGAGYNFLTLGYNAGVSLRPLPDARIQPFLLGMYGYNAAINVTGMSDVSKNYYGFSTGLGGELRVGRKHNHLYAAVLYPFRSQTFHDNYDMVKNNPYVDIQQDLLPITVSIGFNWSL